MSKKPQIVLSNGVEVISRQKYIFDAQFFEKNAIHSVSHAHSDHLPKRISKGEVVCSDITMRCINECTKHSVTKISDDSIEMLNSGHMAGSTMFHLHGSDSSILYTGDFSTRDRFGVIGAKPQKTDILITESTFGRPNYTFPPQEEMGAIIHDWAEDNISQGHTVVLQAYPFGKSQDLLHILSDLNPFVDDYVAKATASACPDLSFRLYSKEETKGPFVLICRPYSRKKAAEVPWRTANLQTAAVSGWAVNPSYRYMAGVNEAFPLSDHAGFDELLDFAKACQPSLVLTHHGYAADLAREIKAQLGIDARPLIKGQSSIFDF